MNKLKIIISKFILKLTKIKKIKLLFYYEKNKIRRINGKLKFIYKTKKTNFNKSFKSIIFINKNIYLSIYYLFKYFLILIHFSYKFIYFFFSITPIASILERMIFIAPSSSWIIHFESP